MKNRSQSNSIVAILLVALVLAVIGLVLRTNQPHGQQSVTTLKPLPAWTNDLVLPDNELPAGWKYNTGTTYDTPGVSSRYFGFYNTNAGRDALMVNFSEEFGLFSTPIEASQFYTGWVDTFITPQSVAQGLNEPEPQLEFPHHADQMRISCFKEPAQHVNAPFRDCSVVARYQNVILHMHGNVYTDRWLTLPDFRAALIAADKRIVEVMSGQNSF